MKGTRFEIKDSDFESLESFPLGWRWLDKKYADLPEEIIAQINPLKTEKAIEIYSKQSSLVEKYFDQNDFFSESKNSLNFQSKDNIFVKNWLKQKISDVESQIYLSYEEKLSIRTTKEIFCDYWSDFCYPASDDIVISTDKIDWILIYHHEEIFLFKRLNEELI